MLALIGLSIMSGRGSQGTEAAALNVVPPAQLPAGVPTPQAGDAVPSPTPAILAEMTRRLGTPGKVSRLARRHARDYRAQLARIRARARRRAAAAAAAAARAAAQNVAGYWVDPQASAVASSGPSDAAENAWLRGGYGGWVESNGMARPPVNAPDAIKRVIQAGNNIARAPYLWGGGHGAWQDKGYDCSGSVSYALAAGGMLGYTLTSGQLMNWGEPGPGRWLTIYANEGHVFMYVAGLRFDTSGRAGDHASRWQLASRSANGFVARHYPGL
jgi:cell wall-associated NlpC family hydrolase